MLISALTFACDCEWEENFIHASKYADLIVKAKIIEHKYHLDDKTTFTSFDSLMNEIISNPKYEKNQEFYESIIVEVIEIVKGVESRSFIEIYGTDGSNCNLAVRDFEIGKEYLLSLIKSQKSDYNLPNEDENDFTIFSCSENWLEYFSNTNEVKGKIKGKSHNRKGGNYNYNKLINKITRPLN